MNTLGLPAVGGKPAAWELLRGALRRITWRPMLLSIPIGIGLWLVNAMGWSDSFHKPFDQWLSHIVSALTLTLPVMLATFVADEAVERGSLRVPTYVSALTLGAAVGAVTQYFIITAAGLPIWGQGKRWEIAYTEPAFLFFQTMMFGGLAVFVYVNFRSSIAATRARHRAEMARLQARRNTFESQLQAMQARVEPQFLFNTLAQVRALYESDPERAGRMLDDLITYLRTALPQLRESSSSLGKEVLLAETYLNILLVGLGERLSVAFDVPAALGEARLPPMLLLPLIDHVLARSFAAPDTRGAISIGAETDGTRLRVWIADTTGRFDDGASAASLRDIVARVNALYGDAGSLRTGPAREGSRAILEIPYDIADDDHR